MAEQEKKKSNFTKYITLILVMIIVVTGGIYWYLDYMKYVSTDDAHVDSDNVAISSKILGRVVHLYANEGDSVKKDMLIAELDSTDLLAQRENTFAVKNQAVASKIQAEAKYHYDEENIKTLEVTLQRTLDDFNRAKEQAAGDVITKEQFEHIKKSYESAQAQLDAAKTNLTVSKAMINSASASIETAGTQINLIETQLKNTKIYAPFDGIVAKRWLLPGDIAQPGQSVLTITSSEKLWVVAFLEETKLTNIHIGQKATFTIDAFPDVVFYGNIFYIGSNSASQFSLIPPNNASGNFTKVTQRIPIKISIDGVEKQGNLKNYNIISGMSAVIKIQKKQ